MYLVGIFKRSSTPARHITRGFITFIGLFFVCLCQQIKAQSTASKQVSTFTISAPELDTTKLIWVYIPKSYSYSSQRYPVLYMHDAQNLFDASTSYVGEWQIDEYLDGHPEMESIVIGIEHGNDKRIDELTPFKTETYGGGNGNAYLSFIVNTLKPYIDKTYRTKSDAQNTGLWGSSLGGLITFYGILTYPETFSWAGVFSPAFWINPEIRDMIASAKIPNISRFYFLAGTDESETMVTDITGIIQLLKTSGVTDTQIRKRIVEGGKHNEEFWGIHFGEAYRWFFSSN